MSDDNTIAYSISPAGEKFPIPDPNEYNMEFERLEALAAEARAGNKEIVVVMGVGFVGAVMDCFGILTDDVIKEYLSLDCEVRALGRGHIERLKEEVGETAPVAVKK